MCPRKKASRKKRQVFPFVSQSTHKKSATTQTAGTHRRYRRNTSTKNQQRADARMQVFVFTIGVFLALCGINLIGLTDYVEPQKTTAETTYQVGDPDNFFDKLGPVAEKYSSYGIYPSVMLAQAALESQYGESQLSYDYNNYFGIKAHGNHKSVRMTTTEYYTEKPTIIKDNFCVYKSPSECFKDYAELLTQNENYVEAVEAASPAVAARALQEGGYATDPSYANKLISIINEYNLTRFDPMTRPKATVQATETADASDQTGTSTTSNTEESAS